jgi:hypothetical protein|tara:strand:- start:75 stop:443 length:369 start_codon:yes stop_codon:yes gene_type:complete
MSKSSSRAVTVKPRPSRPTQKTSKVPVLVRWLDIVSWSGWNEDLINEGRDEPAEFFTLGYVINETERKLTISDTENAVGNVTTFPKGCIVEVIELEPKEAPHESIKKGRKSVQGKGTRSKRS